MRTLRAFASVLAPVMVGPVMLVPILLVWSGRSPPASRATRPAIPTAICQASSPAPPRATCSTRVPRRSRWRAPGTAPSTRPSCGARRSRPAACRRSRAQGGARRSSARRRRSTAQGATSPGPRAAPPRPRASCAPPSAWTAAPSTRTASTGPMPAGGSSRSRPGAPSTASSVRRGSPRGRRTGSTGWAPSNPPPAACASWTASSAARPNAPHAAAGERDELVPYLPYRRQGESVESLRERVGAARTRSAETGEPVESLLRKPAE